MALRINEAFLERVAIQIMEHLVERELVMIKADTNKSAELIKDVLVDNFQQEEEIEAEAEKMMDTLLKDKGEYDRHKMFLLLKSRIASQKGFVL